MLQEISSKELSVWLARHSLADEEFASLALGYSPLVFESALKKGRLPSSVHAQYLSNLELIQRASPSDRANPAVMVKTMAALVGFEMTQVMREHRFDLGRYQQPFDLVLNELLRLQELEKAPQTWVNERRNLRKLLLALAWTRSSSPILYNPIGRDTAAGQLHKRMTGVVSDLVSLETFRGHLSAAFDELHPEDKKRAEELLRSAAPTSSRK